MKVETLKDFKMTPEGKEYKVGHIFKIDPYIDGGETVLADTETGEDLHIPNSVYWYLLKQGCLKEVRKCRYDGYDWDKDPLGLERNRW